MNLRQQNRRIKVMTTFSILSCCLLVIEYYFIQNCISGRSIATIGTTISGFKKLMTDSTNVPLRRKEVEYDGLLVDTSGCTIVGYDSFDQIVRDRLRHQPEVKCDIDEVEENLPMNLIVVTPSFRRSQPRMMKNLQTNASLLATPFDVTKHSFTSRIWKETCQRDALIYLQVIAESVCSMRFLRKGPARAYPSLLRTTDIMSTRFERRPISATRS